jgi:3-methylcrotonyl-CoA carboxylase alpha subunit/geranyl-CoA carboxylase alpha subunit
VQRFVAPHGVRMDHALHDGAVVPPFYDSMLGKLIAHAPTRDEAVAQLVAALEATVVLGLPTNRRLLIECLRDPVFREGGARIPFLAERGEALRAAVSQGDKAQQALLVAGVWCAQAARPLGRTLAAPFERPMRLRHRDEIIAARVLEVAPDAWRVAIADATRTIRGVPGPGDDVIHLVVDGTSTALRWVRLAPAQWHLQIGAVDAIVADASFDPPVAAARTAAPEIRAPFSGRVVAVHASSGRQFAAGDTLVVIEAMKLEHAVSAPHAATVAHVAVGVGQQVSPQQVLLTLEVA